VPLRHAVDRGIVEPVRAAGLRHRHAVHSAVGVDLKRIALQIRDACGGKLYAVVATHRHKDHISGFSDSGGSGSPGAIIASCKPEMVLQPWTENPDAGADATSAASYFLDPSQSRVATTGAVIGEKDCWNKGYGTDAKMALLEYAFNTLNLRKIMSSVIAFNGRSKRYSEKCGYRVEGRIRAWHFKNGRYWDEMIMSVTKSQWLAAFERYRGKKR